MLKSNKVGTHGFVLIKQKEAIKMGKNLLEKIVAGRINAADPVTGTEVGIKVDAVLLNDTSGPMSLLQFEAIGLQRIKCEAVAYIDHQTLQEGFENADDHEYLRSACNKFGALYSRAGNGICHQVHLERFSKPGRILIGTDSHTPTSGGVGMLAIGVGGLDAAVAMGGGLFYTVYPKVTKINLVGRLKPWCSAKDIALEVLRIFTVKGNVGTVLEYGGEGVRMLSIPERATIANMGTETGVTSSIFPSDEVTREFMRKQNRLADWQELTADTDAAYDRVIEIDLDNIEPLVAAPHSPGNVKSVKEVAGLKVDQVLLGSCTNSSYRDLMVAAEMLRGKKIADTVSVGIAPGSKQVLQMIAANGALEIFIAAGVRILEAACGFCFGSGQSPKTAAVSLRTNNRNFKGRSGTESAAVYLVSPETAVAAALTGWISDPRDLRMEYPKIVWPDNFLVDDSMIMRPNHQGEIVRGPNIGLPVAKKDWEKDISGKIAIKVGDNITTDHILPAGSLMKYRSNVPKYAEYVFKDVDSDFAMRCKQYESDGASPIIIGGWSYGQGSSREHAAICPMYLGVQVIIAKSYERIHWSNLINFGIIPLVFETEADYERLGQGDILQIENIKESIYNSVVTVQNITQGYSFATKLAVSDRQRNILRSSGLLNHTKNQNK